MIRLFSAGILLIALCQQIQAQTINTFWLGSFNTFQLDKKFSLHLDAQFRTGDKYSQMSTLLVRPGINYKPNDQWMFTLGYAYTANRRSLPALSGPNELEPVVGYIPEHRFWEQALYTHKLIGKNTISHRIRLEQRVLMQPSIDGDKLVTDGNTYSNRFRYWFRTMIPFNQQFPFKQGWFGSMQNEVFLNFGDKSAVNGKTFDQNRLFFGAGYRLNPAVDFEVAYINQHVIGRGDAFVNNHVAQAGVYLRL
jgi:hypothetical protein